MWQADNGQPLRTLQVGTVSRFALSPDGKTIVAAGFRGMRLWDAASGEQLRTQKKYANI
jgi:hypothetical protein